MSLVPRLRLGTHCRRGSPSRPIQQAEPAGQPVPRQSLGTRAIWEHAMLTSARLESILARIPELTIGVVGDVFLDRYLDLDAALTEPSLETGLDAYQVVRVRAQAGAAGTVLNNPAGLGVK